MIPARFTGPAWRCKGTGELRYGMVPPGMIRPPHGQRSPCPGCRDCLDVVVRPPFTVEPGKPK